MGHHLVTKPRVPKPRLVEAVLPLVRLGAGRQRGRGAGETAEVRDLTVSVATGKFGRSNQQNENIKKTKWEEIAKKNGKNWETNLKKLRERSRETMKKLQKTEETTSERKNTEDFGKVGKCFDNWKISSTSIGASFLKFKSRHFWVKQGKNAGQNNFHWSTSEDKLRKVWQKRLWKYVCPKNGGKPIDVNKLGRQ